MVLSGNRRLAKRRQCERSRISLFLQLLAILTLGNMAAGSEQAITLNRATTFDVTAQLTQPYRNHHAALEQFAAKQNNLYFLFSAGTPRRYQLLRTNLAGERTGNPLDITMGDSLYGLAIDDTGKAVIYSGSAGGVHSILECDLDSHSITTAAVDAVPFLPVFVGNHLVGFSQDGMLRHLSTPTRRAAKPAAVLTIPSFRVNGVSATTLPGGRLLLVDRADGSFTMIRLEDKTANLVPSKSTDVQNAIALSRKLAAGANAAPGAAETSGGCCNTGRTAVAYASAADPAGGIYLGLSPYKPTEGAPIIQMRDNGQPVRLIRCLLVSPHATPQYIGVVNQTLVLASHWGVISTYNLVEE